MIAPPFNDHECLDAITRVVIDQVQNRDPVFVELASQHPTTEALAAWIRSQPQRDDLNEPGDDPKVTACTPPQRLHVSSDQPNCVERAALYLGVAELIDAGPVRKLATTGDRLHTFPIENNRPVVLDPEESSGCLECGLALMGPSPIAIEPAQAIEWTADLAASGAAPLRNGPSHVIRARNAIRRLVTQGAAPAEVELDAIGLLFALAERAAARYGVRAIAMVRTTARAIAEVLDTVLAERGRNLTTPSWLDQAGGIVGRIGLDLGSFTLRKKLAALGVGAEIVGLIESDLNKEGYSLGPLAHPPALATFAKFASERIG